MDILRTEYGNFYKNETTGQSAEEVYQEWLENKDKPPLPSFEDLQIEQNVDMDYRLSLQEMGL